MVDSGEPQVFVSADTTHKSLFGRKGEVLNLGHLYFDIVSTVRCPVEDFVLRFSYFAGLAIFTLVERALQIHLFMQIKANFQKSQINVSNLITRDYDKLDTWSCGKNKAKTNPIQTQNKAKTKPIQTQTKPISRAKKCCLSPLCYRISKEKMLLYELLKGNLRLISRLMAKEQQK